MPFWSTKTRTETVIKESSQYNGFEPYEIALEDFRKKWLVGMKRDGINVGINWTGSAAMGFDLDPTTVLDEITDRIESHDNAP